MEKYRVRGAVEIQTGVVCKNIEFTLTTEADGPEMARAWSRAAFGGMPMVITGIEPLRARQRPEPVVAYR
ncbi:MAG: hypothetical protein ACODAC_04970 [Pseudomonadota bacterium]